MSTKFFLTLYVLKLTPSSPWKPINSLRLSCVLSDVVLWEDCLKAPDLFFLGGFFSDRPVECFNIAGGPCVGRSSSGEFRVSAEKPCLWQGWLLVYTSSSSNVSKTLLLPHARQKTHADRSVCCVWVRSWEPQLQGKFCLLLMFFFLTCQVTWLSKEAAFNLWKEEIMERLWLRKLQHT